MSWSPREPVSHVPCLSTRRTRGVRRTAQTETPAQPLLIHGTACACGHETPTLTFSDDLIDDLTRSSPFWKQPATIWPGKSLRDAHAARSLISETTTHAEITGCRSYSYHRETQMTRLRGRGQIGDFTPLSEVILGPPDHSTWRTPAPTARGVALGRGVATSATPGCSGAEAPKTPRAAKGASGSQGTKIQDDDSIEAYVFQTKAAARRCSTPCAGMAPVVRRGRWHGGMMALNLRKDISNK
jgi:hypothetical protein